MWDVLMGFIYLSCYLIDPFAAAFRWSPFEENPWLNVTQRFLTCMIVIDMILTPFTAIVREESMNDEKAKGKYKKYAVTTSNDQKVYGLDDPILQRDIKVLWWKYFKIDFQLST